MATQTVTKKKISKATYNEEETDSNIITVQEAYMHSLFAAVKAVSSGLTHLEGWKESKISTAPQKIYDINGTLLFYDFAVIKGKQETGTIRAAASKLAGAPVISLQTGPKLWDEKTGRSKIASVIRKKFAGYRVISQLLVCYSYPKIGLMLTVSGKNQETEKLVFDIADYSQVSVQYDSSKYEGTIAWSYLGAMDDKRRKANISRFEKETEGLKKFFGRKSGIKILPGSIAANLDKLRLKFKFNIVKELQFCNHYNYNEPASHHCFVLHAQQVNDYCAVATCQMILCYYRYYYSQDDIAPALGYNAGSGCPKDQSPGYKSLSNDHLGSSFDESPTWEKARDQVSLLHPLKSGIPGHARACAGYAYIWELGSGISNKQLYIYDPWPWNSDLKAGGAVYWEDWDSVEHTNFVYTDLDY